MHEQKEEKNHTFHCKTNNDYSCQFIHTLQFQLFFFMMFLNCWHFNMRMCVEIDEIKSNEQISFFLSHLFSREKKKHIYRLYAFESF